MSTLSLPVIRHSLSHIMAQATRIVCGADVRLAIGPPIENGWYYDMEFSTPLEEKCLKEIQKKMNAIVREGQECRQFSLSIQDAMNFFHTGKEKYKLELLEEFKQKGETMVSFFAHIGKYQNPAYASFDFLNNPQTCGEEHDGILCVPENTDRAWRESQYDFRTATFIDLCHGPHIKNTRDIAEGSFCLDKLAGAYWRGDEKREQLTRLYGLSFENKEALTTFLALREEAKKRDHRILGKKLKLFTISDLVGPGLPLLQPRGMILRKTIEEYLWELHEDKGYDRVWTPHIARELLYETSGHAGHYLEDMFSVWGGTSKEKFYLKPMNCPHHMQIFADNQFSYRDMPIRYFEPATVYRDEKTGQLSGLTRVRSITQDDGHLFCRKNQIQQEVATIIEIIKTFYTTFGLMEGYWVSLSVRDSQDLDKYLGENTLWEEAEKSLEEAAKMNGLNYKRLEGEAAFYGPKLDFIFKDALGREWQLATIQCDFNLPKRFELSFTNESGEAEQPIVIHRAISGSLERFLGIMIEHFGGVFPLWLAPEQVRIIPINPAFSEYTQSLYQTLRDAHIRTSLDDSKDSLGKKIRNAEMAYVNYILVIGEQEVTNNTLAIRNYKKKSQESASPETFLSRIQEEIDSKRL